MEQQLEVIDAISDIEIINLKIEIMQMQFEKLEWKLAQLAKLLSKGEQ